MTKEPSVLEALSKAAHEPPPQGIDGPYKGWVLVAFQLAFYTLLHQDSFEQGMVDLIMRAGDADTNAVIYGPWLELLPPGNICLSVGFLR